MFIVKLRTIVLLVPSDDSELDKYLKCGHSLRRTEGPSISWVTDTAAKTNCSSIADPAENT
jgi:hypothetical protein